MSKLILLSPNPLATMFLYQGAQDYMAARCCLLNGQFPGLMLAQQAVEKTLKGIILLHDSNYKCKKHLHDVVKIWNDLKGLEPKLVLEDECYLQRLNDFYTGKYPDSTKKISGSTLIELKTIDRIIFELSNMISLPNNLKYRVGIFGLLSGFVIEKLDPIFCQWLFPQNYYLSKLIKIIAESNEDYSNA
jgi:HEPN domain-containing protein